MSNARPDHPVSAASLAKLAFAVAISFSAAMIGQLATLRSINDWYVDLAKPSFTPPNAVFPIAWSLLYALMALAFWRILRLPSGTQGRRVAIGLFLGQLVLNAGWSWAFFGQRSPVAGLIVIIALDIAVALTTLRFWQLNRAAGVLMLPYLAWILFATALNAAIVFLN